MIEKTYNIELTPYWVMDWNNEIKPDGTLNFQDKPPGVSTSLEFEPEEALAQLLAERVLMLSNNWWRKKDGWNEEQTNLFSISIIVNDIFFWACADVESISYADLKPLYDHWLKDPVYGGAVFACKKRNMMPQKPIYDHIKKIGIWDLDELNLGQNPTWKFEK